MSEAAPQKQQAQLMREELVIGEARPARPIGRDIAQGLRRVHPREDLVETRPLPLRHEGGIEPFRQRLHALHGELCRVLDAARGEPFRER